jgi:HlyD family secretion protein
MKGWRGIMSKSMLLPAAAAVAFAFAGWHMISAMQQPPRAEPKSAPPSVGAAEFGNEVVAGAGVIEARTENISLGTPIAGVVERVFVVVGDHVKPGQPLFELDSREAKAELAFRESQLLAAESQLAKLESMPRKEELPASLARIKEAEANYTERQDAAVRARSLASRRTIGQEELIRAEQNATAAKAALERAQADHQLLTSGAWEADKAISKASIAQAKAAVDQARTVLERHRILAPTVLDDGKPLELAVLQVNVRPGEYVAGSKNAALMMLGNLDRLHVRVDVDENDIPRFKSGVGGRAVARGGSGRDMQLRFVRVEPFVIPKRSLTGESNERVDTRVLQVLFEVVERDPTLFVGQQVDAFLSGTSSERPSSSSEGVKKPPVVAVQE